MLLAPIAAPLARLADRALWLLTGAPGEPPRFDGLLDELFARWPLDAAETPFDAEPDLRAAA